MPVQDIDDTVLTRGSNPSNPVTKVEGECSCVYSDRILCVTSSIEGSKLVLKHIMALTVKRFHHSKRNKKGFVCEIILPAFFVCLAMVFTLILPALVEEPPLEISPWIYPTKVTAD